MRRPVETVTSVLGREAVAFALNLPLEEFDAVVMGEIGLAPERDKAVGELLGLVTQIRVQAAIQGADPSFLLLLSGLQQGQPHFLTRIREQLGGTLDFDESTDPVGKPSHELATTAFPGLLIARHTAMEEPLLGSLGLTLPFPHPARRGLEEQILADPQLGKLFPRRGDDALQTTSWVQSSSGRGGTLQLVLVPDLMIRKADQLARLRGQRDLAGLVRAVDDTISLLRRVSGGEAVDVPALVGFNNVAVQPDVTVALPWGRVSQYRSELAEFVPSAARPATLGSEGIVLGAVLETSYTYEVRVQAEVPGEVSIPRWSGDYLDDLANRIELTRLSIAFGIDRKPAVAAIHAWTMICHLLEYGTSAGWRLGPSVAPVEHYIITASDAESVAEWAKAIAGVDDSAILIARRRVLSALSERADPTDGLIDAVVAWENLFGSASGELSLRISGAMAWLLGSTGEERADLQERLKALYSVRSRLLHGDLQLDSLAARKKRDDALDFSIRALRRLYRDRPELIEEKDRALRLILAR